MANMKLLSKNIALAKLLSPLSARTSFKTVALNSMSLRQDHFLSTHRSTSCFQVLQQQPLLPSLGSVHKSVLYRTYHEEKPEQTEAEREENFEEHEQTIYKGILSTQIKLVKSFSLLTSIIGLSCQPVIFMKMGAGSANIPLIIASGAFLSFFTFATPLLIHWVSKKYVVELVYNKIDDTYTAITYSLLLRKKQVKFRVTDVHVPDIPGMFTTFKANNVPLFVDGEQFDRPVHFGKIMGYDKPLNLRWEGEHTQGEAEARRKKEQKEMK